MAARGVGPRNAWLAESVVPDGAVVPLAGNLMRVAELELAFRMATDLSPRAAPYGVDEVLAAVATLHPAIEIPDSRYEDFCAVGAPQLIADNACGHRFMLGPAATFAWRGRDLAAGWRGRRRTLVRVRRRGGVIAHACKVVIARHVRIHHVVPISG